MAHCSVFRPKQPYRIFNTWLGDPGKIFLLEAFLNVLKRDNLLCQVNKSGEVLKAGLLCLQKQHSNLIDSVRGKGTFMAFNAKCPKLRDDILARLKKKGMYPSLFIVLICDKIFKKSYLQL